MFLKELFFYIFFNFFIVSAANFEIYKFNKLDKKETFEFTIRGRLYNRIGLDIQYFINITCIRIENTNIDNLPNEFSYLKNLKCLFLYKNKFIKLPIVIGKLFSLKELNINEPLLQEIRMNIAQLCDLKELYITAKNNVEMPNIFHRLITLRKLFLYKVNLTKLYDFSKCKNLVEMNLIDNNLKHFPISITKLKNLQQLCIIKNNLNKLPNSISRLQKLQYLFLHNTSLKNIPEKMGTMKNLIVLSLKNNLIKSLPLLMSNLQDTLFKLDLIGNKIKNRPVSYTCKIGTAKIKFKKNIIINFKKTSNGQKKLYKQDLKKIFKNKIYFF